MLWFYMDEARPYILQYTSSTFILVSLVNLSTEESNPQTRDAVLFLVGAVLLCGSSLMGVIFSLYFGLAFLFLWVSRENLLSLQRRPSVVLSGVASSIIMLALGSYYLWTLQLGARASGHGKTNLMSIAFSWYELLGFSGIGPSRTALRENPIDALMPFTLHLGIGFCVLAAFVLLGFEKIRNIIEIKKISRWFPIVLVAIASTVTVLLLGVFAEFRTVGRHLMPIYPFILLAFAQFGNAMWERVNRIPRLLTVTFLAYFLFSSISLRISPRFAKDDYRSAAKAAQTTCNEGGIVWCAADQAGAKYYGLSLNTETSHTESSSVFPIFNNTPDSLVALPRPITIILSKTDIYDSGGSLREWIKVHDFTLAETFPAFQVFVPK